MEFQIVMTGRTNPLTPTVTSVSIGFLSAILKKRDIIFINVTNITIFHSSTGVRLTLIEGVEVHKHATLFDPKHSQKFQLRIKKKSKYTYILLWKLFSHHYGFQMPIRQLRLPFCDLLNSKKKPGKKYCILT